MTLTVLTMVLVVRQATSLITKTIGLEVTTGIIITTIHGILHGTITTTRGTLMVITMDLATEVMATHFITTKLPLFIVQTQLTGTEKVLGTI